MTEISLLKYVQWRPIGVCDTGEGKQRKAKIFSKVDLEKVTSSGISRGNWRQNPKIMKIIKLYAMDVAKISTLTKGMINPVISEVELVGAVLGHDQTPILNQESLDGRVQFFQITYRDLKSNKNYKKKYKKFLKWAVIFCGIILSAVLIFLFSIFISELSFKKNLGTTIKCGLNREHISYSDELRNIRESLLAELSRLPEWLFLKQARLKCNGSRMGVNGQEKLLLNCFFKVRNISKKIEYESRPTINKIESCAISLCKMDFYHLKSLCKRL